MQYAIDPTFTENLLAQFAFPKHRRKKKVGTEQGHSAGKDSEPESQFTLLVTGKLDKKENTASNDVF